MTWHPGFPKVVVLAALAFSWPRSAVAALGPAAQGAGAGPPNLQQLQQLAFLPEAEQRAPAAQQQLTEWFLYRVHAYQRTLEGDAIASIVNLGDPSAYRARMAGSGGERSWYVVFRDRDGGGPTKNPDEPFIFPNDGQINNILDHDAGDTATCWHELQHGLLAARNLGTRGLHGADQEHVYLETYAQPTVAWLRDLNRTKRFEGLAREANNRALDYLRKGIAITAAMERDIWGRAAQAWRSALNHTNRIAVLDETLRQEYLDVAGVRVPTVNEVIAFYQNGSIRTASGDSVRIPIWVMCREFCLDLVSIERQAVFQPPSVPGQVRKASAFKLMATRQSAGGAAVKYAVDRGRLRVKLLGDDDQALLAVSAGSERLLGIPVPGGSSTSLFDVDVATVQETAGGPPTFEVQLVRSHPEQLTQNRTYRIEVEYSDPGNPPVYDATSATFLIEVTPPMSVAINGPRETRVGQEVTLSSTTGPSAPSGAAGLEGARVDWLISGHVVHSGPEFHPDVRQPGETQVTARLTRQGEVLATSGTHLLRVVIPAAQGTEPPAADTTRNPWDSPEPLHVPRKGAWVLQDAKDITLPGLDQIERYANDPDGRRFQNRATISAASAATSCAIDYRDRKSGAARSEQRRSTGTWTEPAAILAAETPISVGIRSECQSPNPSECNTYFFWGGRPAEKLGVTGTNSASARFTLARGVAGMWMELTASHSGPGGGTSRKFSYAWQDQAVGAPRTGESAPETPAPQSAGELRREGKALQDAGKLTEAVAKYRESLRIEPSPGLEYTIAAIESELEVARLNRELAAMRRELESQLLAQKGTLEASGDAPQAAPEAAPRIDPKQREKALKLRREGEAEEAKQKPKKAIEKYRESLEVLPDPALEQRVRDLEPLAEREELERKAKRLRDLGRALEGLNQPAAAAKKYRESNELIPDPELERRARKLDAEAGQESGAQQIADVLEAERRALERQLAERRAAARPDRTPSHRPPPTSPTPRTPTGPNQPPQTQPTATAAGSCSATGEWVIEGGGAILFLQQTGGRVSGRKETVSTGDVFLKENISGTFSGNVLRVAWSIPADQTLLGTMSGTCNSMQITVSYTLPSGSRSAYTAGMDRRR
jgi:tetratricopeptide (TPR) repeat protein